MKYYYYLVEQLESNNGYHYESRYLARTKTLCPLHVANRTLTQEKYKSEDYDKNFHNDGFLDVTLDGRRRGVVIPLKEVSKEDWEKYDEIVNVKFIIVDDGNGGKTTIEEEKV
tara:strand:- start:627 stop:965 length:339 start_codon:yes stop_codon:yes gene_type:complete